MKPHFSVILPTYNRPDLIPLSIKSVLNQDFKNLELIILDDYGKDNTEDVVKSFKDRRIKFVKNKKNIGYGKNLIQGFEMARGTYIFLLGDDDVIVKKNTLSYVYKNMEEKKAGYGQLTYMFYNEDLYSPSAYHDNFIGLKTVYLKPAKDILIQTVDWHFGSISGSVFRRDLIKPFDIIDDVWWPYYRAIYRSILAQGCIFFGDYYILAKISTSGLISFVDVKKNKGFYMSRLFIIYKEFDANKTRFEEFRKRRLEVLVSTFLGIKYYTNNHNLLAMKKEIFNLEPRFRTSLFFWIRFTTAFILPKSILGILRALNIKNGVLKMERLSKELDINKDLDNTLGTIHSYDN